MLGYVHHSSIDELPNWVALMENAEAHPGINTG